MKRANPSFGSPPPQIDPDLRRPGESHTRLSTTRQLERRPQPQRPAPASQASTHRQKPADAEEPRTGVVRRLEVPSAALRSTPAARERRTDPSRARRQSDARVRHDVRPAPLAHDHVRARHDDTRARNDNTRHDEVRHGDVRHDVSARHEASAPQQQVTPLREPLQHGGARDDNRAWRCLEWGQPPKERRPRRDPKVSVAQLSASGDLLRQHGPDASLPETADFIHKMSGLIAQGFGYVRCQSVCLKAPTSALSVSEVGGTKLMAVTGPLRSMSQVLRRAGLE